MINKKHNKRQKFNISFSEQDIRNDINNLMDQFDIIDHMQDQDFINTLAKKYHIKRSFEANTSKKIKNRFKPLSEKENMINDLIDIFAQLDVIEHLRDRELIRNLSIKYEMKTYLTI